jgi:hypothetical protein
MGQRISDPADAAGLEDKVKHLTHVLRMIGGTITAHLPGDETAAEPIALPGDRRAPQPHLPDMVLGRLAGKIYLARRERERAFPMPDLFHDPAWDMLLDIFIAHAQDKYISVTDATLSGQVPVTTALRYVWALEKAKLIERKPDTTDKRRRFVILTEPGLKYMRQAIILIGERMAPPLFGS